jgi:hypothetical protein
MALSVCIKPGVICKWTAGCGITLAGKMPLFLRRGVDSQGDSVYTEATQTFSEGDDPIMNGFDEK